MTTANQHDPDAYVRLGRALWQGDEYLRNVLELSPIGLMLMAASDLRIVRVNAAFCELLGRSAEELCTLTAFDIIAQDERAGSMSNAVKLRAQDVPSTQMERRFVRPDGTEAWGLVNSVVVRDPDGAPIGFFSQIQDITQRKQVEKELRASEERFRTLFEHASVGQCLIDVEGRLISTVNPALARLLGRTEAEMVGQTWDAFIHPEDRALTAKQVRALSDGAIPCYESAQRYLHRDGQWVETYTTVALVRDRDGSPHSFHILIQDETSRFEAEQRRRETEATLAFQASHDTLTSLPNRALFADRLRGAIHRLRRGHRPLAVLFVDLDRFKYINDSMGHGAGDLVLFETAARLSQVLRPTDTLSRFGGDEFTVLCEDVDGVEGASAIAARVIAAIEEPLSVGGRDIYVGASVGIAVTADRSATPEALLSDADAAMYRAKEAGRGRYEVFDEHLRSATVRRIEIQNGLRRALEAEELVLHYQPIVDLHTARMVAVEALVRWQRGDGQLYSPAEFIPVAEETGLIHEIGEHVLVEACRQAADWRTAMAGDDRVFHVTVNISPLQLMRPGFAQGVADVLQRTGLPAEWLCLEITESALMADTEAAISVLEEIRDLGVRIGIDDFGTGYSSLSYLQRFPVDLVKIDRSFTMSLDRRNSQANALVGAVVHIGTALGISIVAEGVETREQANILAGLGVEVAQGYMYSRPRPASEVTGMVLSGLVDDVGLVCLPLTTVPSARKRSTAAFGDARRSLDRLQEGRVRELRAVNQ